MGRYKVLQGAANSIRDSFVSAMNYNANFSRHALGSLLLTARELGEPTASVNLLTGEIHPSGLIGTDGGKSLQHYSTWFPEVVERNSSHMKFVQAARLEITFDLASSLPCPQLTATEHFTEPEPGSPYDLSVIITDDRGKDWSAHAHSWEYPESIPSPNRPLHQLLKALREVGSEPLVWPWRRRT